MRTEIKGGCTAVGDKALHLYEQAKLTGLTTLPHVPHQDIWNAWTSALLVQIKECKKDTQLQKEMQLALHPEYGQAESAALAKELSRLRLCLSELQSQQRRLQTDISNAIAKRETSVVKVGLPADSYFYHSKT